VDDSSVGADLDALLDRADAAMYRAKASGKRRWSLAEADGAIG
jgi:PleD family two-component response regulator